MQLLCTEERHSSGGPGHFVLARSEEALPALIDEYGGRVQLIYLEMIMQELIQFNDCKRAVA